MALFDTVWYVNSVGYAAVTAWATATAKTVGQTVRQNATPTVGNERVFICVVAGTTHATTEPTWTVTRGAKTTDNTVTWQECSGMAAVNGDTTNTPLSSAVRSQAITLGVIVKNNSATHLFICTTAGSAGAGEPSYNTTTGATTTDSGATWTCIGAINAFSGGANPHARLRNALATNWWVNGSKVFMGANSAETQAAAYSITVGQSNLPLSVFSHNQAGAYPPTDADLSAGATITTTGANGIALGSASGAIFHGVVFQAGSGAVNSGFSFDSGGYQRFINCSLQKLGTTANAASFIASTWQVLEFINTTFKFGAAGDAIRPSFARWNFRDTPGGILASGSSVPTRFLHHNLTLGQVCPVRIDNCDLSQITTTILSWHSGNFGNAQGPCLIKNCKVANGAVIAEAPFGIDDGPCDVVRCSDTAGNLVSERYMLGGKQSLETTIIRTGGASDGTDGFSWKIVTTTGSLWQFPFECQPLAAMNAVTGSPVTVTVEGIWGGGAVPNNDDIWMEVTYLGSSSTPLGSKETTGKDTALSTATAVDASSAVWGGSTTAFKLEATITPEQVGPIEVCVKIARASSTFYVDPKVTLS